MEMCSFWGHPAWSQIYAPSCRSRMWVSRPTCNVNSYILMPYKRWVYIQGVTGEVFLQPVLVCPVHTIMRYINTNFTFTFTFVITECSCLHGACDNRLSGSTGLCKPYSCQTGFTGVSCDVRLERCDRRRRLRCHAFADCIRQRPTGKLSEILGYSSSSLYIAKN